MSTTNTLKNAATTLAQKVEQLDALLEKYSDITRTLPPPSDENSVIKNLLSAQEIQSKVSNDVSGGESINLRIGIIGRVKAGKSSLLNALLFNGENILPQAATPMTASLTVLRYGETPYAEVEFFNTQDRNDLSKKAKEYDQKFQYLLNEKIEKLKNSSKKTTGAPIKIDIERQKSIIQRQIRNEDPALDGAKQIHEEITKSNISVPESDTKRIDASSISDLQGKLNDYVGADGSFTPLTKCMNVYLPIETLKHLEVVDTPGVNDPISSREARTMDELHSCHAAFVVSVAGQFLNQSDTELMGRLARKGGVEEIFLVASQADLQLIGSEYDRNQGRLPDVLESVRKILAKHAEGVLKNLVNNGKGFEILLKEIDKRVTVSSGAAYTLAINPQFAQSDENLQHVQKIFQENYPDYFSNPEKSIDNYKKIAGIEPIQENIERVRQHRKAIIFSSISNFLDAQNLLFKKKLQYLPSAIQSQKEKIIGSSKSEIENQIHSVRQSSARCVRAIDTAISRFSRATSADLSEALKSESRKFFSDMEKAASNAKGSMTESYTVDSSGVFAGLKRFFGIGGTETRTRDIETLNATQARRAIEELRSQLEICLEKPISQINRSLSKSLESELIGVIRRSNLIPEKELDVTIFAQSCEASIHLLAQKFDSPSLPSLPNELSKNGTLKGTSVDDYIQSTRAHIKELRDYANIYSKKITENFEKTFSQNNAGAAIMSQMDSNLSRLQEQLKNKEETLAKFNQLSQELKLIS